MTVEISEQREAPPRQIVSIIPGHISQAVSSVFPHTLTLLVTYRCNAKCEQCCFESNPTITERLSLDQITGHILEAKSNFPALKLVVFSGGECFLLKQDLFKAISFARSHGLMTRCVTNGFWGKTPRVAVRTVKQLISAGLTEINISTGRDHQQWVPLESVENAASALIAAGIRTVVTVEADAVDSECVAHARDSQVFRRLLRDRPERFTLQTNIWMPFNADWQERRTKAALSDNADEGCGQVFGNTVVTPHNLLSSCCGLTLEHIPEMKIADLGKTPLASGFTAQYEDFLKIWIHVDGPSKIVRRLFPENADQLLGNSMHMCQACAILHKHPQIKEAIKARYSEFVPDVLARFNATIEIQAALMQKLRAGTNTNDATVQA